MLFAFAPFALALSTLAAASEVSKSYNSSGTLHFGDWSDDGQGACNPGYCWNASFGPVRNGSGNTELALLDHGALIGGETFSFWDVVSSYRHTGKGSGYGVLISEKGHCLALARMPRSTTDLVPFTSATCSWEDDESQMLQTWRWMSLSDGIRYFGFFGDKTYNPNVENTLYDYSNMSDSNAIVGMQLLYEQYPGTYWLWFNAQH